MCVVNKEVKCHYFVQTFTQELLKLTALVIIQSGTGLFFGLIRVFFEYR